MIITVETLTCDACPNVIMETPRDIKPDTVFTGIRAYARQHYGLVRRRIKNKRRDLCPSCQKKGENNYDT